MNGLLSINSTDVIRALVIAVIGAILTYISTIGDVFALDWRTLVNIAVITGLSSLLASFGTTTKGNFIGAVKVEE